MDHFFFQLVVVVVKFGAECDALNCYLSNNQAIAAARQQKRFFSADSLVSDSFSRCHSLIKKFRCSFCQTKNHPTSFFFCFYLLRSILIFWNLLSCVWLQQLTKTWCGSLYLWLSISAQNERRWKCFKEERVMFNIYCTRMHHTKTHYLPSKLSVFQAHFSNS